MMQPKIECNYKLRGDKNNYYSLIVCIVILKLRRHLPALNASGGIQCSCHSEVVCSSFRTLKVVSGAHSNDRKL